MNNYKIVHFKNFEFKLKLADFQFISDVILSETYSNNSVKRKHQLNVILKWLLKNSISIKVLNK